MQAFRSCPDPAPRHPAIAITVSADGLYVEGEIDAGNAEILREAVVAAGMVTSGPIRLDLSGVEFMDSAGIGVLIDSFKVASDGVAVVHPSVPVQRILQLTGLYHRFVEPIG
jgi:anti-sigma B factor antagonist